MSCGGSVADNASGPSSGTAGGPDLVLVTIDTLRWDAVGFSGDPRADTPSLDRVAAEGRVFPDAHAHGVVTLPSHATILTGLYPHQHGVRDNGGFVLGESAPTLATLLAPAGYASAAFVGAYPLDSRFGLDRGFELYDDDYPRGTSPDSFVISERPGNEVVDRALAWWRANEGRKRFLWVHLYDPHAPYDPPEPFASRFADAPYLGEVAATDRALAPLLDELTRPSDRGTVTVVTSDHGEALGDHGELTHGLFAYEATLKVPLVLWGRGVEPGVDPRPAGLIDVAPTLLTAAGVEPPEGLPGRSLLERAVQERAWQERPLYFEALSTYFNRGWAPLRGVVRGGHKWIELPLPELYALDDDPAELRNLVEERRPLVRELRAMMPDLGEWPPERGAVGPQEAARLRSLGYLSGSSAGTAGLTAADDPKRLVVLDRKLHAVVDLYSRGRLAEAEEMAREVIAERPEMAVTYQHLALVLRRMGRLGEAIQVVREARGRGLDSPSLARDLGLALAEAGAGGEAVRLLEPLASEEDPESLVALGDAYFAAGDLEAAGATYQRALGLEELDVQALEGMGAVWLAAGRPDRARELLARALELERDLPVATNSLGVALYQLGEVEDALDAWERAVALDPGQLDALFNLGKVAASREQPERAREALSRFVAAVPPGAGGGDLAEARRLLADLGVRPGYHGGGEGLR